MTMAALSACGRNPSVGWDVCVRGGVTGRRADARAGERISLQSPLFFLPPRRRPLLSGAGTQTDGRATWYAAALTDRRRGI